MPFAFNITNAYLTGDITLMPRSVQYLYLSNNDITGTLYLLNPKVVIARNTMISEVKIDYVKGIYCDLSNNVKLNNKNKFEQVCFIVDDIAIRKGTLH